MNHHEEVLYQYVVFWTCLCWETDSSPPSLHRLLQCAGAAQQECLPLSGNAWLDLGVFIVVGGTSKMVGLEGENPIKMDDLGYPYFEDTSK